MLMHTLLNAFTMMGIPWDVRALSIILAGTLAKFNLHLKMRTRIMDNNLLHDPLGSQTIAKLLQHALSAMTKAVIIDARFLVQTRTDVHARKHAMIAIIKEGVANPMLTYRASRWTATRAALMSVSLLCTFLTLVVIATMGILLISKALRIRLATALRKMLRPSSGKLWA